MRNTIPCCVVLCLAAFTAARGQDGVCTFPLELTTEETDLLKDVLFDTTAEINGFDGGPFHGIAAPLTETSPVADGEIGPGEYPNSCTYSFADRTNPGKPFPSLDMIESVNGSEENDLSLTLHTAHTDAALFMGFEVTDEFLDLQQGVEAFTNDSVELFINADLEIDDYNPDTVGRNSHLEGFQIVADAAGDGDISLNNRFTSVEFPAPIGPDLLPPVDGEYFSAGLPTDTGWILEFHIPLTSLDTDSDDNFDVVPAETGSVMLMNFSINDNDVEGASGQDTHAMLWVVEGDERSPFGGGENVWPVPLKLTEAVAVMDPLDCDADGAVTVADLECANEAGITESLLTELNILAGDLNGDGEVAFPDFLVLSANFGTDASKYTEGDIDGMDGVAFADFLILSANFGKTAAATASAVPEPSGLLLLLLGLFGVSRGRRRR